MARRSAAEQRALDRAWRSLQLTGDQKARDFLFSQFAHLVPKTRTHLMVRVPPNLDPEDIDAEGKMGLLKAIDRYDPNKKVKFESYAISMIRGAIQEFLRSSDDVSRSVRDRRKLLQAAQDRLIYQKGTRCFDDLDCANELSLTLDKYYELIAKATVVTPVSLEETSSPPEWLGSDSISPIEAVASQELAVAAAVELTGQRELIRRLLVKLEKRQGLVLYLYYWGSSSFREISTILKISESRVHQIYRQALNIVGELYIASHHEVDQPVLQKMRGEKRKQRVRMPKE